MNVNQVGKLELKLDVDMTALSASLARVRSMAQASGRTSAEGFSRAMSGGGREAGNGIASGVSSGLSRAESDVNRSSSRMSSKLSSGLRTAGTVGAAAVVGALAGIAGVATYGVKIAAQNEQAAVSFKVLLGDGEKAQAFMKDIADFAATTPFEMAGLRTASSRLLAVGMDAKEVIPVMTGLGDATSAMGTGQEGIDRGITAITQMLQKGKIYSEEMLQLTEAGIPAWQTLSDTMGRSVADIQAGLQAGEAIDPRILINAISKESGPAFAKMKGLMAEQSKTFMGQLSNLKDMFDQNIGKAMTPLMESLKEALGPLTDFIQALLKALAPAFGQIGKMVKALIPLLTPLGNLLAVVGDTLLQVVVAAANALLPVFTALAPVLGDIVKAIGDGLLRVVVAIAPYLGRFAQNMATLLQHLLPVIPKIFDLVLTLEPFINYMMKIQDQVLPIILTLIDTIVASGFIDQLVLMVGEFIKLFAAIGTETMGILLENLNALLPIALLLLTAFLKFTTAIMGVETAVMRLIGRALKALTPVFDGIKSAIRSVGDFLTNSLVAPLRNAFNAILDGYNSVAQRINGVQFSAFGKDIGAPDLPIIPALANGGIVTRPTLALIGEAGPEAVVPLSRGGGMGTHVTVNVNIGPGGSGDPRTIKEAAKEAVNETLRQGALRLVAAGR